MDASAPVIRPTWAAALVAIALVSGGAPAGGSVAAAETDRVTVLVHAARDGLTEATEVADSLGLRVGTTYPMIDVFVASGSRVDLDRLAGSRLVDHLEPNAPIYFHTDTSHAATRGERVLRTKHDGRRIDGRGIGVAVVDSGVDGTHPDLVDRMGGNVRIVCTGPGFLIGTLSECAGPKEVLELDNTDTGGHGTHVAGIVAGTGAASDGKYQGAAPGATVYGVAMGTVVVVENALDGLRWVLENHDEVKPRIRVVNNSWGSGYDPQNYGDPETSALTKMVEELVDEGITVVFSAGNTGGDGTEARTSLECTIPAPGVICVANYDDANAGTRDGAIRETSSRGTPDDPSTWPDVSAPGTGITAACRRTYVSCADSATGDDYATLTGTSMAAPHVAGIVAQLLQVRSALTPAEIEDLLEDAAHEFEWGAPYGRDPANRDDTSSFEKGHGLVDVLAVIRELTRR